MADVIAHGHDGGSGGDPGGNWQPPAGGCGGDRGPKKVRKEAKNLELGRLWKKNGFRPLPIEFDDINHDNTWRPVGDNGDMLITLVGTLVREIPYRYPSWEAMPASNKEPIFPTIETFFDMRPHYEGDNSTKIMKGFKCCV